MNAGHLSHSRLAMKFAAPIYSTTSSHPMWTRARPMRSDSQPSGNCNVVLPISIAVADSSACSTLVLLRMPNSGSRLSANASLNS